MTTWTQMVLDWHNKFGVDVGDKPTMITGDRMHMRQNILQEEVDELNQAYFRGDIEKVADAICDILYVVIGTAIEFGLHDKLDELFAEVHRSNMSKLDENGNPVKREDGKILKSKLFSPPDLKKVLTIYRIYKDGENDLGGSCTLLGELQMDVTKEEYERWTGRKQIITPQTTTV